MLKEVWGDTGLSLGQWVAKHPGTDRGTISRYLNGARVPSDHRFLDALTDELDAQGKALPPGKCDELARLHISALQAAHPHEYRVLRARDELRAALDAKQEAEQRLRDLEEQLAGRTRELRELAADRERLRTAWGIQLDWLTRQIEEITGQLGAARQEAFEAGRRCRDLEDSLRRLESPVPAPPVPAQLPRDIVDFTGRRGQVEQLSGLLGSPAGRDPGATPVALVTGPSGSGKTSLAVHAAHQLRALFPDGQLYADLLGTTPFPLAPADVLGRFLRDLGAGSEIPPDEAGRAAYYRTILAGRRILVVLDNARDAGQVRALVPGSESCAAVITSRSRMPDLVSAKPLTVDVLGDHDALALFEGVVGDGRAAAEPDATAEVLIACGGLPLAVRICGAQLAARTNWPVSTLASRLRDETHRLDEMTSGDLSVRASFEASFSDLPGSAAGIVSADAFRLLGLWRGLTISPPAAAALFGSGMPGAAAALDMLVDAHLLESPAPNRFGLHDLLRLYAAERALADLTDDVRSAATARLLRWYLRTADAAATTVSPHRYSIPLSGPADGEPSALAFTGPLNALDWYCAEMGNVVAATRQAAAAGLHDIAWQLPVSLFRLFDSRHSWADCAATHLIALDSARQAGDPKGEAWVLNNLGVASAWTRDPRTQEYLERSLQIRREIGDQLGEVQSVTNLAGLYRQAGRGEEAEAMLHQALKLAQEAEHRYGEGVALTSLSDVLLELNRPAEAIGRARRAHNIFYELNSKEGIGCSLDCIGRCLLALGRSSESAETFTHALDCHRDSGNQFREAVALRFLGRAQARNGQAEQAEESRRSAAAIYDRLGERDPVCQTWMRHKGPMGLLY